MSEVITLENSLEVSRRLLGDEHPDVLQVMRSLATKYLRSGRDIEAAELFTETVNKMKRVWSGDHMETLITLHGMAISYEALRRKKEVSEILGECVEIKERMFGQGYPD